MKRIVLLVAAVVAIGAASGKASAATVAGNYLLDQDHGLQFSQNKQNENSIVRAPSGALIAGANDEIQEPLCPGTSTPLASPCPFDPGVSVNGYYRSTDNGVTWTGGILPNTPTRVAGGDPSLDYGPRRCAGGPLVGPVVRPSTRRASATRSRSSAASKCSSMRHTTTAQPGRRPAR